MYSSNPAAAALWNSTGSDSEIIGNTIVGFYHVNWTPEAVQDFQNTILGGPIGTYCASVNSDVSANYEVYSKLSSQHI